MNKIKLFLLIIIYWVSNNKVWAQKTFGLLGSNYAGVSNIDLNPSSMVLSKITWELNFFSIDVNGLNNSFYVKPTNIFSLLSKPNLKIEYANTIEKDKIDAADAIINPSIVDKTFFSSNVNVKGPSFFYTNGMHAFSISTALRVEASAFNLPKDIVTLGYENFTLPSAYNQRKNIKEGTICANITWAEIGGSYAKKVIDNNNFIATAGVSLKFLLGYSSLFAISRGMDYIVPYEANFTATNVNLETGSTLANSLSILNPSGKGVSSDIGITIYKKAKGQKSNYLKCPIVSKKYLPTIYDYKWKLGLSLVDLGGINFNNNALLNKYNNIQYTWDSFSKIGFTDITRASRIIYDSVSMVSPVGVINNYFMNCPTAFSLQFDYNFSSNFYLNAIIIQRIAFSSTYRLERMNSIIITPRYERSWVEFSLPFVLNEYAYLNWGLMLRLKSFFIGTDQLASTFGFSKLNGLSIYTGIKINKLPNLSRPSDRYKRKYMKKKKFSLF